MRERHHSLCGICRLARFHDLLSLGVRGVLAFAFVTWLSCCRLDADQVIISEVMHAPVDGEYPWVEVQNLTATPFDIAEWRLNGNIASFQFPAFSPADPDRSFLRPFERIVITGTDPSSFRDRLNLGEEIRVFGPWSGKLKGERDELKLLDKNGIALCSLEYGRLEGWPFGAIGTGHSMVVVDEDHEIDQPGNWRTSSVLGGTPGRQSIPPGGISMSFSTTPNFQSTPFFDYDTQWKYDASGRCWKSE